MKIKIKKEIFSDALEKVTKVIKVGNVLPILECVLIDATKDNIKLTCTDGSGTYIIKEVNGEILEKGKATIEGKFLYQVIKNMQDDFTVELEVNKDNECNINDIDHFQSKDESLFPNIINIKKDNFIKINNHKLKKIINKTSFACSNDDSVENKALKGIHLKIEEEKINANSTNGYIAANINESLPKNFGNFEVIVVGNSIDSVNAMIKDVVDNEVTLYFNEKNVSFEFDNTLYISNIIDAKPIDLSRLYNVDWTTKVTVNRFDFIEHIYRTMPYVSITDRKPVIFEIKEDMMSISLTSLRGEHKEDLKIDKEGNELRIAFNPSNLLKILDAIDDDNVTLYFTESKQPVIIKDNQETYKYLLVPVNIK